MRAMAVPTQRPRELYDLCVSGISDVDLRQRISDISGVLIGAGDKYYELAIKSALYTYPVDSQKKDGLVAGLVTKNEIKTLYNYYFVGAKMPAREIYNKLVSSAPNGVCPLCGSGYAVTLDHYLPKGKYPLFAILPQNLVPACRDCNTGKLATAAVTIGEQSLHPYFDHAGFIADQWLFADIIQTAPPSIRYKVLPPVSWPKDDQQRVASHFDSLKLSSRFSVLAANELSSLRPLLVDFIAPSGPAGVQNYLNSLVASELKTHKNSWRAAMYQALSNDLWYCSVGFKL